MKTDSRLLNPALSIKVFRRFLSGRRARSPQKSDHPQIKPGWGWL